MHKIIFLLCLLLLINSCAENKNTEPLVIEEEGKIPVSVINNPRTSDNLRADAIGELVFTDTLHEFFNVKEGDIVAFDFEYTNVGKKDVIITEAIASCGCTVPEFKREPIKPGEKGNITVKFNSAQKKGANYKNIKIKSNANPGEQIISIKAMVQ
jgi:hypothetical protein